MMICKTAVLNTLVGVLMLTLAGSGAAMAQWKGGVEGGTVVRDGQNATQLRLRASLDERPLSHYVYAEWVRSSFSSYELGYKPRYWFNERLYSFGEGSYRLDRRLNSGAVSTLIGGVGLQLISTQERQAWIEGGVGYRYTRYDDDVTLEDFGERVGLLRGAGYQILSDLFKLEVDGSFTTSPEYLQAQLETGVSMKLPQGAIKVSHRIRRTEIGDNTQFDDSDTAVAFTVGF